MIGGQSPLDDVAAGVSTVPQLVVARARAQAEDVAVVDDAGILTYGELFEQARAIAAGLQLLGCAPGDRFAFQLPNGRDWIVAYWAAALAGLVVVPIDVRSRPAEVEAMTRRCDAAVLVLAEGGEVTSTAGETAVLGDLRALSAPQGTSEVALAGLEAEVGAADVHLLQFTSGSTGVPKAAMLTHRGLLENGRALAGAWGLGPGEALVVPSPLSHILGFLTGCLVPMVVGATSITMAAFAPERALELIDRYRAVGVAGTPTHHLMLVEHPDRPRYDCSSLRFAMYGGAPMTPDTAGRITEGLGIGALLGGFGMSETSGGVTSVVPGDPVEVQLTTVGRPLATFEVRVVDPSSGEERAVGEMGELWVRGDPVCSGYWADPEETARAFAPGGWFRTGDLVVRRGDGCLSFAGRLKEIILVGGYTVSPAEIERVLTEHPAVAEAVVVGAPEARLGEIPVAFVRLAAGAEVHPAELEAHCRSALASHKVPRYYAFRSTLPVSSTGKVRRPVLREEAVGVVAEALLRRSQVP